MRFFDVGIKEFGMMLWLFTKKISNDVFERRFLFLINTTFTR